MDRIICRFAEEIKTSKNTWAHAKMANYLYLMLKLYPYENVLDKYEC